MLSNTVILIANTAKKDRRAQPLICNYQCYFSCDRTLIILMISKISLYTVFTILLNTSSSSCNDGKAHIALIPTP